MLASIVLAQTQHPPSVLRANAAERHLGAMASKAVVVGGIGATLSVEHVLHVARGTPCALDVALVDKLTREQTAGKTAQQVRVVWRLAVRWL